MGRGRAGTPALRGQRGRPPDAPTKGGVSHSQVREADWGLPAHAAVATMAVRLHLFAPEPVDLAEVDVVASHDAGLFKGVEDAEFAQLAL